MAQHDYVIANGTGSAVRSDLNDALAAIVSMNSGSTEPSATFAFQFWADTNANLLKMRNSANDGWIELRQLDGEFTSVSVANGTAAAPSIFFNASGTDTGIYSNGTDSVDVSTGGTRRLDIGSAGDVTVRGGNVTLNAQGDLRLADSDSSNWVAFQAPATVASNVTWTLPSTDGTNGDALTTNGSGTLSWTSAGGASITQGNTSAEVVDTGSDGHFKVVTEGTEALRVDSSQRVGIGINSPAQNLHIASTSSTTQRISRTGLADGNASDAAVIEFANGTGAVTELRSGGDGDLQINTRSLSTNSYNNSLFIKGSTGNVGIGLQDPSAPLDIQTPSGAEAIRIRAASGVAASQVLFRNSGNSATHFRISAESGGTELNAIGSAYLTVVTNGSERLRVDPSGNLKFNSGYGSAATAYGCRAWVNFNGTGTVAIREDGNVSSISDNGTGSYNVNFSTAMPDANYATAGTCRYTATTNAHYISIGNSAGAGTYSTSAVQVRCANFNGNTYDCDIITVAVFR